MNRNLSLGLLAGSVGCLLFGELFAYAVIVWFVLGTLLYLFLTYFLLPLLYCQDCNDFHVFGVNNHENEHSLGKDR